jgi:hypothetical protein
MIVGSVISGVIRPPVRGFSLSKGVGASQYAPYPAPSGFRWDFVTYSGERVTSSGEPVVALIGA